LAGNLPIDVPALQFAGLTIADGIPDHDAYQHQQLFFWGVIHLDL
jgi:hypothetical protein